MKKNRNFGFNSSVLLLVTIWLYTCKTSQQHSIDDLVRPLQSCPDLFTYNLGSITKKSSKNATIDFSSRVAAEIELAQKKLTSSEIEGQLTGLINKNLLDELKVTNDLSEHFYETWNRNAIVICRIESNMREDLYDEEGRKDAQKILNNIYKQFASMGQEGN